MPNVENKQSLDTFDKSFAKPFIFGQVWRFRRCILLPFASPIFGFWQSNRTRRFQQVPGRKAFIHPLVPFQSIRHDFPFSIFQWISHLLTLRLSSKTTTPCSWLVPFLARGGDVDHRYGILWVRWKGSKTLNNLCERNDDGDVEGKKPRPHLSCSTICLKGDGDVTG